MLSGPIGSSVRGFPSGVRGIGATPPEHLDLEESVAPIEDHGFTLVDFLPDRMVLRQFKWDVDMQPFDAIDRLEPFGFVHPVWPTFDRLIWPTPSVSRFSW